MTAGTAEVATTAAITMVIIIDIAAAVASASFPC